MNTGRMIGPYEIKDLLGEGGVGQVHVAYDTMLDREVAIKSLRPEMVNDAGFVSRFRSEASNLAKLTHPNITTLYSLLPDGGNLYMVMELVRGRTLEDVLKERGHPFNTQQALAIISQAADGLAYAHSMGIVHRDIKPPNLMITNTGLLKIMDFGIARVQGSQRATRAGLAFGTPEYMSPEQVKGQDVDGRSDLYSLAIVLYEMLTGRVPFQAESDYDLGQMHISATPEKPSRIVPTIEPAVEKALLRALSKKPNDRFDSMNDFKAALGATTSTSEAASIVQKSTRLAAMLADSSSAVTSAVSHMTEAAGVNKASIPFALKGVLIGAGAALVAAAAVFLFFGPTASPPPTIAVNPKPETPVSTSNNQGFNPNFVDPRAVPLNSKDNPNFIQVRPTPGGSGVPPAKSSKPGPFDVAVVPPSAGPAAPSPAEPRKSQSPGTSSAAPVSSQPGAVGPAGGAGAGVGPSDQSPPDSGVSGKTAPPDQVAAAGSDAGQVVAELKKPTKAEALAAYQQKNYAAAFELAEPLAKDGCVECQFILGRLYQTGSGGKKDPFAAVDWYKRAAEAGYAKAAYNLGTMYLAGEGSLKDATAAAQMFLRAASQDDADAAFNLAQLYEKGEGVARDNKEAIRWYNVAVKSTDPDLAQDAQAALDKLERRRPRR